MRTTFRADRFIALLAAAIGFSGVALTASAQDRRPSDVPAGDIAQVTRVIDARTLAVDLNGKNVTVSLLGIDAPVGNACLAPRARTALVQLLSNKLVKLERDSIDVDATGALPRFVYRIDGFMAQEELLKAGLAKNAPATPDARHINSFIALESAAQRSKQGGWSACKWASTPVVRMENGCRVLPVERLMQPIGTLPELVGASDGACVKILKAATATTAEWSGQFVYRPAGSTITPGTLYVRWKDAFVLVNKNEDGDLFANIVESTYRSRLSPFDQGRYQNKIPGETRISIQKLERPANDPALLRIPNPQANLFRDASNGKLTALVDVFEFTSGEARVPRRLVNGELE
jgi:endonuclease YncB( thermonuclease family)